MKSPALQVELEESAHVTFDRCRDSHPVNITRAYAPNQRVFKEWCQCKGFMKLRATKLPRQTYTYFIIKKKSRVMTKGSDRKVSVATVEMSWSEHTSSSTQQPHQGAVNIIEARETRKNKREYAGRCRKCKCHFLCHACLLRGESALNLKLPDRFSVILENDGLNDCRALVMIKEHFKTNPYGRCEFGSYIMHYNVEIYPIGARVLLLFSLGYENGRHS
ncbi:LOW QUALITY PROTEIN: hypothetical protein PHMEG_0006677 [Phytophthora megakarya]|uniref:Uncharacterized protein n=1 Tax=Phytophthora megakarya TaxID=4795 RepID=A0A225WNK7_9STRA|nr:LOW QUALITY PROTEIN: hypothetical protein PHMEG_0006677 [Phytophthora megakarya]